MQENVSVIVFCVTVAVLIPAALYVFLKRKYHVGSQPFWAGVIAFIVFALILERLALSILYKTSFWAGLSQSTLLSVAVTGLIAGIFEESGCLISMKISSALEEKEEREEEEEIKNISDHVKKHIMEAEHERNHAILHGLGHGGAVVFVFVMTMILNLIYAFNSGTNMFAVTTDPIDSMANASLLEAMTSMQGFHAVDFIYTLVEEIAALGIHISLAVMVWISMKGSWYRLFFPLSILLHAGSDILVEVLLESGLSEFMCVVFFVIMAMVIVQFTLILWHKIKMNKVLEAVQKIAKPSK